jgi:hypothetical protein
MAKELPYFKFFVSEWSDGDVTLEDMEVQGLFINLCAYYWSNECNLTLTKAKKRFRNVSELGFENLIENKIISVKNDFIKINFLNEQWEDRAKKSVINKRNGAKGGRPSKNPVGFNSLTEPITETKAKQKAIREEKRREDNTVTLIEDKHREFTRKFYECLEQNGITTKKVVVNKSHIDHIRKLEKVDNVRWEDITSGGNYYFSNLDSEFMPEIQSTSSFRSKFDKLVAHKKRKK